MAVVRSSLLFSPLDVTTYHLPAYLSEIEEAYRKSVTEILVSITGGVSGVRNRSFPDGVVEGISACFSKS